MSQSGINPILLTIPESFESARLLIRAPLFGDGAAVNEAVVESIEELRPWMPWANQIPTIEESEIGIRKSRLEFLERTDLRLLLIHKETGQLVGSSGLHRMDWQARNFETGYWVRTSCAGQGYISEAVEAITEFAIHQLQANRIEIRCDSRNAKSARVAERSGFTLEGILRSEKRAKDGSLRDTMVFSKVRGVEYGVRT
ncbi:ribosomal-protein-serine acetyltransferase [Paenibacillus glycanilyticus]|uniref:Ribosomal-protein-serine acetyltransferase n=1 Tax=Paenibacillus glycanilyticus TaxID=126569 RepID=A0ABQ6NPR7_9BACL|nr:GNAT family N-acetyltransferase [Paenibacillus glycanilyticus]GMK46568.1 ribosomal-protein-serine acetyltransferase [Paenibacillus glycanilyticus]